MKVAFAFNKLRDFVGTPKPLPSNFTDETQLVQINHEDGLKEFIDGPANNPSPQPVKTPEYNIQTHLWVVRNCDVVHAEENCQFGELVTGGKIKHSNLSGGQPAYCGGEMRLISSDTIIINGCSGRYGPKSPEEMDKVEKAFLESGYNVWSMGFDHDAGWPLRFDSTRPKWVTP